MKQPSLNGVTGYALSPGFRGADVRFPGHEAVCDPWLATSVFGICFNVFSVFLSVFLSYNS